MTKVLTAGSITLLGVLLIGSILVISVRAAPTFGIDTSNLVDPRGQTSSTTITLSTNYAPELIGLCITTTNWYAGAQFSPPVVKIVTDSSGLSWTKRGAGVYWYSGLGSWRVEEWVATSPVVLSGDAITTTISYSSYTDVAVFGVVGFNQVTPFDVPTASVGTGMGSSASASITTTNPNDMVIGCTAIGGAIAYGSGYLGIQNTGTCPGNGNGDQCAPFQGLAAEYQMESTPKSNLPVTFTDTTEAGPWAVVADAIVPAGGSTSSTTITTTSSSSVSTTSTTSSSTTTTTNSAPNIQVQPNVPVQAGSTTLVVTLHSAEPDTNYAVSALPNWNTAVWVSGKTTRGFTLNFAAADPISGGLVDIVVTHP